MGRCLACGVSGRSEKDFICDQCGHPKKTMVVCQGCQQRTDLTLAGPKKIEDFFSKVEPSIDWALVADKNVSLGTTIAVPNCPVCRTKKKDLPVGKALIYRIRGTAI